MKKYITKLAQFVSEHPQLKLFILRFLNKSPKIKAKLLSYKQTSGDILYSKCFLLKGFGAKEHEGVWTIANEAVIAFFCPKSTDTTLSVDIRCHFFLPEYVAKVSCNGHIVATWIPGSRQYRAKIPYEIYKDSANITVSICINDIKSPEDLQVSGDSRTLGIFIKEISVDGNRKDLNFNFPEMTQTAKAVHELLVRKINMRNNKLCV